MTKIERSVLKQSKRLVRKIGVMLEGNPSPKDIREASVRLDALYDALDNLWLSRTDNAHRKLEEVMEISSDRSRA